MDKPLIHKTETMALFNKKQDAQPAPGNAETGHFAGETSRSADQFVTVHSRRFKGLDFSVKSLETVEKLLDEASDFYGDMSKSQRQSLISGAGAYIFETARRNFGGTYFWSDKLQQPILVTGQPDFEVSILALEKVKGRLENGSGDNIPFYFAGYAERVKNRQSGMVV